MDWIDVIKPLLSTALSSSAIDKPRQHQQIDNKLSVTPGIEPETAESGSANAIYPLHSFAQRCNDDEQI